MQYLRAALITVIFLLVGVFYTSEYNPVLAPSITLVDETGNVLAPEAAISALPKPTAILSPAPEPTSLGAASASELTPLNAPAPAPSSTGTAAPTPSSAPTLEPTPSPSATPPPESLFDVLMRPFIQESQNRRRERRKHDRTYLQSVDHALNEGRVN